MAQLAQAGFRRRHTATASSAHPAQPLDPFRGPGAGYDAVQDRLRRGASRRA